MTLSTDYRNHAVNENFFFFFLAQNSMFLFVLCYHFDSHPVTEIFFFVSLALQTRCPDC